MARRDLGSYDCSISRTLDIVGERWALLIVYQVSRGQHRFEDLARRLGLSRATLSKRISELVEDGILAAVRYEERPPRDEYHLTEKGKDLIPLLAVLLEWGNRWTAGGDPPQYVSHEGCDDPIQPEVVCSHCGERLEAERTSIRRTRPLRVERSGSGTR